MAHLPLLMSFSPPIGDPINKYPKYVVSGSLQKAEWNNSHILRDVAKDVAALKNTAGGDILVYGSATLVKSLIHQQPGRASAAIRQQDHSRDRKWHHHSRISAGLTHLLLKSTHLSLKTAHILTGLYNCYPFIILAGFLFVDKISMKCINCTPV